MLNGDESSEEEERGGDGEGNENRDGEGAGSKGGKDETSSRRPRVWAYISGA